MSINWITFLNDKGAFGEDCMLDFSFYDHYVLGMHNRLSFSKTRIRILICNSRAKILN